MTDHKGNKVHFFPQNELHSQVAFPGSIPGYPDLYLFGLGPQVHCFQPEREVIDALRPYVEQSERANAPHLARWHRLIGLAFLAFGVLCLAGCLAVACRALHPPVLRVAAPSAREVRPSDEDAGRAGGCDGDGNR